MSFRLYKLVFFVFFVINLFSCRNDFSSRRGGYDYIRIPFIKPYEALRLNGATQWHMNLYNSALNSSVFNIKEVYIENGAILLYSENTYLDGQTAAKAWFIVIPKKHIEAGFSNQNDYLRYLKHIGIVQKVSLIDIKKVDGYFDYHYPINWSSLR